MPENSRDRTIDYLDLPVSGSGCGDMWLTVKGTRVVVEFEFRKNQQDYIGAVEFNRVVAYRFRDELHSRGFAHGSYDRIIELSDSDWLDEMIRDEPHATLASAKGRRHFAVFLSNNGYLEVIADACAALPIREGLLASRV